MGNNVVFYDGTNFRNANTGALEIIDEAISSLGGSIDREPTGFLDPQDVTVTGDSTTRTVTLSGAVFAYYQGILNTTIINGWTSPAHSATTSDQYFLSYDGSTISWTTVGAGLPETFFQNLLIAFAFYDSDNSKWIYLREVHGLMPWESHRELHQTIGTYRRSGGVLQSYTLASTTAADRRPDVEATLLYDEDLPTTLPVLNSSSYTQFYLSSTSTVNITLAQSDIVPLSGNRPYWNEFTGGAYQQTLMANNSYMAVWVLCIPMAVDSDSQALRYLFIQGQKNDNLSNIQALTPQDVSIGDLRGLLPELVVTNKIIIKYSGGNWTIEQVDEITGTSSSQTTSPAGNYLTSVTSDASLTGQGTPSSPLSVVDSNIDHGSVSGLADDDHTQYSRTDGTRAITGNQTFNQDVIVTGRSKSTRTNLIISSGEITITANYHKIDTEASAATDDLDTINGGLQGQLLVLESTDNSRDITLKDGTGNLKLAGDFTLGRFDHKIILVCVADGGDFHEISRSSNS